MSQGEVGATEGFLGREDMWSDTGTAVLWEWVVWDGLTSWSGFMEEGVMRGPGAPREG